MVRVAVIKSLEYWQIYPVTAEVKLYVIPSRNTKYRFVLEHVISEMAKTFIKVVVCLLSFTTVSEMGSPLTPDVHKNVPVKDIIHFMRIQTEFCGDFTFCTVKPNTASFNGSKCCMACSCERTCVAEGRCCPDFRLKPLLQMWNVSDTFETFTGLAEAVLITIPDILNVDLALPSSATYNFSDHETCVSSLPSKTNRPHLMSPAFIMTTSCLTGNDTDDQCSEPSLSSPTFSPTTSIPVYSHVTRRAYNSLTCFSCHEDKAAYVYFDVFIVAYYVSWTNWYYISVSDLFLQISSGHFGFSNIEFKPPELSAVKTCEQYDISSKPCDATRLPNREDLRRLCESFYLPVVVNPSLNSLKVSKNAACNQCDTPNYNMACTSFTQGQPLHIQLYLLELDVGLQQDIEIILSNVDVSYRPFSKVIPCDQAHTVGGFLSHSFRFLLYPISHLTCAKCLLKTC